MATATMTLVRDVMSRDCEVVRENETISDVAKRLARLNVGAMPICDGDKLRGMLTDRDIVTKVIAEGKDPSKVTARELETGKPITVSADETIEAARKLMAENQVRRLPVTDGDKKLVGMLSQADLAKALPKDKAGQMLDQISR